jgi:type IV pilus assembly protein PilF
MLPRSSHLLIALYAASMFLHAGLANAGMFSKKDLVESPIAPIALETINSAQQLIDEGKLNEAMALVNKAIGYDRKSGLPLMAKAYIYDQMGEPKKAWPLHKKALSLSPKNGYVLNAAGVHACAQGRAELADAYFMKAIADPDYPAPYTALENAGNCALKNQKPADAEARYRNALLSNPNAIVALEGMATINFQKNQFMEARAFLQRRESVIALTPALLKLAIKIEKAAGDDRAAASYQKKFEELAPLTQAPVGEGQLLK